MKPNNNINNEINMIENINNNKNNLELDNKNIENFINKDHIIAYISSNLLSIIRHNKIKKKKQSKGINEPLYSKIVPALSLEKYIIRIMKYTEAENNTLIAAYLYIIKLIKKENFVLSINNIYRLLLGSVVLAKKVLEDIKFENSYYCGIGGISLQELNMIEFSLFIRINFEVNIKKEDIDNIYKLIYKYILISKLKKKFNNNHDINGLQYK